MGGTVMDRRTRQRSLQRRWCSLSRGVRDRLKRARHYSTDATLRLRIRAVLHCMGGLSCREAARRLRCSDRFVRLATQRFIEKGPEAFCDGRRGRGRAKRLTAQLAGLLREAARRGPKAFGYDWNYWTVKRFVRLVADRLGVRLAVATMWRYLRRLGIRRVRAKPYVVTPWPKERALRRLWYICRQLRRVGPDEVVVFADESEVHLNPKIGYDWCMRGHRRRIRTPGTDVRVYGALALEHGTRRLVAVWGRRKDSALFRSLLARLDRVYANKRRIHVVLDNAAIHKSKAVGEYLQQKGDRFKLWFLPPFCPDANPVELEWQAFHAAVTVLHSRVDIDTLIADASRYLANRSRSNTLRHRDHPWDWKPTASRLPA